MTSLGGRKEPAHKRTYMYTIVYTNGRGQQAPYPVNSTICSVIQNCIKSIDFNTLHEYVFKHAVMAAYGWMHAELCSHMGFELYLWTSDVINTSCVANLTIDYSQMIRFLERAREVGELHPTLLCLSTCEVPQYIYAPSFMYERMVTDLCIYHLHLVAGEFPVTLGTCHWTRCSTMLLKNVL